MKFSFDKILAAFGNIRAMERTHVDNYTEDIIKSLKDEAFAISNENVMLLAVKELGGFYYLKTIVVGAFKIKTIKGATLMIIGNEFELKLKTDMDEFESEYSNISNRYITRIDFQIEENEVSKIDKSIINTLELKAKKHQILFKTF
ncbi:MAG: hypothetical protein IIC74_05940 [Bacteroidetes bacterium]|nr:hypothetical protein [Bacteroidota bacterium]